MTLEEYRKVHNDRYQPNGPYSFIEWACRRVTALTQLDCALRTEQFIRMRESNEMDFESFRNNHYHDKLMPVAVATYNKVKPRGGAKLFITFPSLCCTKVVLVSPSREGFSQIFMRFTV